MPPSPPSGTPNGVSSPFPLYTREDIADHKKPDDLWIVIHGDVYNVTEWRKRHPGGRKVLQHYGGEDATIAYESFHIDKELVRKHMSHLKVGRLVDSQAKVSLCLFFRLLANGVRYFQMTYSEASP